VAVYRIEYQDPQGSGSQQTLIGIANARAPAAVLQQDGHIARLAANAGIPENRRDKGLPVRQALFPCKIFIDLRGAASYTKRNPAYHSFRSSVISAMIRPS